MMLMTAQIWMDRGSIVLLFSSELRCAGCLDMQKYFDTCCFQICCLYKTLLVEACNQLNDQLTIALNPLFQNLLITSTCF